MSEAHEKKHTALSEMDPLMREKLREGGAVSFSPKGTSMLPMLRSSGDSVTLVEPPARLRKGTVALFVSTNADGERKYVLHRLVDIRKGRLVFMGDNRKRTDETVSRDSVIGVVSGFTRKGKEYSGREARIRLYSRYMVLTRSVRPPALKLLRSVIGMRKLFKKQ